MAKIKWTGSQGYGTPHFILEPGEEREESEILIACPLAELETLLREQPELIRVTEEPPAEPELPKRRGRPRQ